MGILDGDTRANCHATPISPNAACLCDQCRYAADVAGAAAPKVPGKDYATIGDVQAAREQALAARRAQAGR